MVNNIKSCRWNKNTFFTHGVVNSTSTKIHAKQYFPPGTDLLGVEHPRSPGLRVCWGGGAIFHDKAKKNRDKMRYSNLSNNMMISEL
jgi:hypothetical protein